MAVSPPAAKVESVETAVSVPESDFTAPATADAAFMSTNPAASARTAGAAFAALSLSHDAASATPWIAGCAASSAPLNESAASAAPSAPVSMPSTAPTRLPTAPITSSAAPPRSDTSSESACIAPLSWHFERKSATESPMPSIASPAEAMPPVRSGLNASRTFAPAVTADASRLPIAPSNVAVEVAASLATSVMPSCMIAWLNSSADISPFSMASRKLPAYAPLAFMASWSLPDAPGMASASWFQFSVVSFPAPAVWVMTMPTLLKVSALPPATALRLPAASASWA